VHQGIYPVSASTYTYYPLVVQLYHHRAAAPAGACAEWWAT